MEEKKKEGGDNFLCFPEVTFAASKRITFFSSFEEAEDHQHQSMADMTPEQRMQNLVVMQKMFMSPYLLPDKKFPLLKRIITIEKGVFK
ncbi:MAG: hypothetical protein ABIQ74_03175 [Chitinophagales bacterium]